MDYRFISTDAEWKQVADTYTAFGLSAPDSLISPTVGAFDETGKLIDFIILTPIHHAGTLGVSSPEVQRELLTKLNSTLTAFPGSQYFTFIAEGSPSPEGMTRLPVEVYRRVF